MQSPREGLNIPGQTVNKSALPKIGKGIKRELAIQIGKSLRPYLAQGEKVQGIFRNEMFSTQAIIITTCRIISIKATSTGGDVQFTKELIFDNTSSVTIQAAGGLRGKGFYNITSIVNGKSVTFAVIKFTDVDDVMRFIQNITPGDSLSSIVEAQNSQLAALKQQKAEQAKRARQEQKQAKLEELQLQAQRASSGQCPKCGSDRLQAVHSTTNKGFNDTNACGGCCLFGPAGLLCGLCGSGKKEEHSYRMCLNCGHKF